MNRDIIANFMFELHTRRKMQHLGICVIPTWYIAPGTRPIFARQNQGQSRMVRSNYRTIPPRISFPFPPCTLNQGAIFSGVEDLIQRDPWKWERC